LRGCKASDESGVGQKKPCTLWTDKIKRRLGGVQLLALRGKTREVTLERRLGAARRRGRIKTELKTLSGSYLAWRPPEASLNAAPLASPAGNPLNRRVAK